MEKQQRQEKLSMGESLKQKRKELNLSLKEAETATSIRMNYLQAIEENQITQLISTIYAQGFVKQYAIYLGLDGEQLIREHHDLFSKPSGQEFSYGIGTLEVRGNPGAGIKWFPNVLWVGAFFGMIFLAWFLARFLEIF